MPICYLTGRTIKEKDDPVKDDHKSLEHIIPNALGGRISSNYVLTFKANQQLNEEIDKEFNKIFASFTTRLSIEKDRKSNPSIVAFHKKYQADVIFKNGRYYPKKPFYDKEKKIIYADSEKTGKNFRNHLIANGDLNQDDQTTIMNDLAGEINTPFTLENVLFKKGLAKIAAGFATYKGIQRKNLKDVLDLENNKFLEKIITSPHLPTTHPEGFFEENIHNSPYFPIHSIVLCGKKSERFLYCYVELFSAFHFYVLLDQDYGGNDIYESYIYSILEAKEITYTEYVNSIPGQPNLIKHLPEYKKIDSSKFVKLTHAEKEDLRFYCHRKFNTLSAFTNYLFISQKAEKLGLLKPDE